MINTAKGAGLTLISASLSSLRQIIRDSSRPTFILSPRSVCFIPFEPADNTALQPKSGGVSRAGHLFLNGLEGEVLTEASSLSYSTTRGPSRQ